MKQSRNILFIGLLLGLMHIFWNNMAPIWNYILGESNSSFETILTTFTSSLLFAILIGLVFSILLSINIIFGKTIIVLINFIASIYSYYVFHFGIQMNDELMMTMLFFTESNDIFSSFDIWILVYVPLIFLPSYFALNKLFNYFDIKISFFIDFKKVIIYIINNIRLVGINLIVLVSFIGLLYIGTDLRVMIYKLKTISEQVVPIYFLARRKNAKNLFKIHNENLILKDYIQYNYTHKTNTKEPLIVVLIVGESLRSDRLGINGYSRDTTPHMNKITNLFSFKNVISCGTTTAISLPCMLTNEPTKDWSDRFLKSEYTPKYSIAKIFTNLGFETKWISAANKDFAIYRSKDFHGANTVILSSELRKKYISKKNDFGDNLLVEALDINIPTKTLYVLGTMGSHRDYYTRYTQKHAIFKPDIGTSLVNINNAYDNTVIYFDSFIFNLTQKLKHKNAFLLYLSDHGESLGENGIFLHGAKYNTAPKAQTHIPMIAWMSDKFIKNNPLKYKNIKEHKLSNANGESKLTHDYLFHSLLNCSGITSDADGINDGLSICGKLYKE